MEYFIPTDWSIAKGERPINHCQTPYGPLLFRDKHADHEVIYSNSLEHFPREDNV
jgi:hypothetical protein